MLSQPWSPYQLEENPQFEEIQSRDIRLAAVAWE